MHFSKAIIVNPPNPPGGVANRDSMGGFGQVFPQGATVMPPLDIPYLAGYLAEKAVPFETFEAQGLNLNREQLALKIAATGRVISEKLLVVVRASAATLDWDLSVCAAIKNPTPNAAIAVYGPVVPHVMKRLQREPCLEFLFKGEPDQTLYEIMLGCPEAEVLGLVYRTTVGWTENAPRPFLKHLDELPFPKWELLPYQRYTLPKSSTTAPLPFLPMLTSRGCPFGCHYCPYPVGQGLPWRFRTPKNVVDEIEHLVTDLGIRYILFRDPMFSLRQDRVLQICAEIMRRGLKFKWKCETRPDCLNLETIRAMAAAGCEGINFGVESAEVEIQANVGRKPISREKIIEMTALCRNNGIKTFCFFIIGLPGDTVKTILETIGFAIRLKANWIQFTAASPFVGTKLREWAIEKGLVEEDEYAYVNSHEALISNGNLSKTQIASFLKFAQIFERYLINRGGILKDDNRTDFLYSKARWAANQVSGLCARAMFSLGRKRFERLQSHPV